MTRKLKASAALLLLVAVAGCGGSRIPVNQASSPLGDGGGPGTECAPDPFMHPLADGLTVLENHSASTVVIEHVSYYGVHHIRLIRAVIVPIRFNSLGMTLKWPPIKPALRQPGVHWDKRVPAAGAAVPPATAKNGFRNLVIEMQPTSRNGGTVKGVQVRYRADGKQYELRTHTAVQVLVTKKCI